MKNAIEIKDMELNEVTGGMIFPNRYSEEEYNARGIKTEYHWIARDEFWLPDGTKTDVSGANEYMKQFEEAQNPDITPWEPHWGYGLFFAC